MRKNTRTYLSSFATPPHARTAKFVCLTGGGCGPTQTRASRSNEKKKTKKSVPVVTTGWHETHLRNLISDQAGQFVDLPPHPSPSCLLEDTPCRVPSASLLHQASENLYSSAFWLLASSRMFEKSAVDRYLRGTKRRWAGGGVLIIRCVRTCRVIRAG